MQQLLIMYMLFAESYNIIQGWSQLMLIGKNLAHSYFVVCHRARTLFTPFETFFEAGK